MNPIINKQAGVDWLTVTARSDRSMLRVLHAAEALIEGEIALGAKERPFEWQGYTGRQAGAVSWGRRMDSVVAVVKGQPSHALLPRLVPFCDRITRLDLQVTCEFESPAMDLAREAYSVVARETKLPRALEGSMFVVGLNGGQTCYLGKRGKVSFARIYDKGVQEDSRKEGYKWRWEVQMKHPMATQVGRSWLNADDHASWIASFVHDWFEQRKVAVPWTTDGEYSLIEREAVVKSDEITLAWLRGTVRPVIMRLIEAGLIDEVAEALTASQLKLPLKGRE